MATGQPLPVRVGGVHGAQNATGTTAPAPNSTAPVYRGRIEVLFVYSSTVTITGVPSGWSTIWGGASGTLVGSFRMGVYWNPSWNINDTTTNPAWTLSASAPWVINGNDWEGIASSPLVGTPVTASGLTASAAIPSMTLPTDACLPLWFWAARWANLASTQTIGMPSDLASTGNVASSSTTTGVSSRCGSWMASGGQDNVPMRTPTTTGTKTSSLSTAPSAWSGIGLALGLAEMPGNMLATA